MNKLMKCLGVFSFLVGAIQLGCTSNPFGDNEISGGNREVRGQITLAEEVTHDGIFVWMQELNVSTRTDANGSFRLTLPPPASQNASGGLEGAFNVYYYVANYGLKTSEVLLQRGEFVYAKGDINGEGRLVAPKQLNKLLEIRTSVEPASVPENFGQRIGATVNLRALVDSVTVVFPNSLGGFLGAIFLRNNATGQVFIAAGPPTTQVDRLTITNDADGHSRTLVFDLIVNPLPVGQYEVIPYLLVAHEPVPEELFAALGSNVAQLMKEPNNLSLLSSYLAVPFRRDLGILIVGQD